MVYIYIKWPHIYNFLKNNIAKVCTCSVLRVLFPVSSPKGAKKITIVYRGRTRTYIY